MKQVYKHVNDIDLYVGGIHEKHDEGSMIGHTFKCIIGDVFTR